MGCFSFVDYLIDHSDEILLMSYSDCMRINLMMNGHVSNRVSENSACKMSTDNLATVFGPTIVGYSSAEPTMNHIMVQTKLQQLVSTSSVSVMSTSL